MTTCKMVNGYCTLCANRCHVTMQKCESVANSKVWEHDFFLTELEEECNTQKKWFHHFQHIILHAGKLEQIESKILTEFLKFWVVVKSVTGAKRGLDLMSHSRIERLNYLINDLSQSDSAPTEKSGKC